MPPKRESIIFRRELMIRETANMDRPTRPKIWPVLVAFRMKLPNLWLRGFCVSQKVTGAREKAREMIIPGRFVARRMV